MSQPALVVLDGDRFSVRSAKKTTTYLIGANGWTLQQPLLHLCLAQYLTTNILPKRSSSTARGNLNSEAAAKSLSPAPPRGNESMLDAKTAPPAPRSPGPGSASSAPTSCLCCACVVCDDHGRDVKTCSSEAGLGGTPK